MADQWIIPYERFVDAERYGILGFNNSWNPFNWNYHSGGTEVYGVMFAFDLFDVRYWLIASADGMPDIIELNLSVVGSKVRARKDGPTLSLDDNRISGDFRMGQRPLNVLRAVGQSSRRP